MATGRTTNKWLCVYCGEYDLSGFARTIGPLEISYDEVDMTAPMSDSVKGYLRNHTHVNCGTLNALFDNTATTGIHAALSGSGIARVVTVAYGIRAEPAAGDPAFCGCFTQQGYQAVSDGGAMVVNVPFSGWAEDSGLLTYGAAWGQLLHANAAATGANTGTGSDNPTGAATTTGGYLIYHILSSNAAGTATLSVDDSADNSSFQALSGATTGALGYATFPTGGMVALGTTATVRRYLRWQLALAGGCTTVTFISSFVRG